MAIVAIIVALEALLLLLYVSFARVYFLLSIIVFLLYFLLKYYDGDEQTGARAWPLLRNKCTLFGKSVQYYFGNIQSFEADQPHERMLFVVVGNLSNMGLIHAFGLHGGIFQHVDLVYMLPRVLFRVPVLRDFLLWTGAVSHDESNLLRLLRKGKSVAYCPSSMQDLLTHTNPRADDQLVIHAPTKDVFEFAMKHKVQVIPVLIAGETKRYAFYRGGHWMNRVQQWCYERWGWPFPLLFFPRIFGNRPPPKLDVQVGYPMDASIQENAESFAKLFKGQFAGLVETGGDDCEFVIK